MFKKQHTVSTLTIKVKYIALEHDVQQKVWIWKFINELKLNNTIINITLLNDNKLNIKLVHNIKQYNHTKHINVQHHYIQNMINNEKLIVKWVIMKDILINELMKVLTKNIFWSHHQWFEIVQLDRTNRQRK